MALHTHGGKTFEARRVFTDREEPVALFETAFTEAQERDDHRVLCWYGVGGQGKSSLHDEIRRRIKDNVDVALAGLNFDVIRHHRLEDAMLKLRGDLAGRGLTFPTFDLAFARHFALERPGEKIREAYPQLFRKGESPIIDDMIDWSEATVDAAVAGVSLAVPGLNLLYRYGARLTGRLADWWASRPVKDRLVGLDQLSLSDLAARLPQYLGFDIWRARAEIGCPRIVITIDTHEKLGAGELRGDLWLQTLVREMPGALILIFGRDKLRWAEIDDRWDGVLDQHLLHALSDADADDFLSKVPIPQSDIRARIVRASAGLPHYLDLSVSQYEIMKNAGQTPALDDFGTTLTAVREGFLELLKDAEKTELFLAAYPESLSEGLFLDLAEAFLGGAGMVNWARLTRRSFMTLGTDGRVTMHGLMRDALQAQDHTERAGFYTRVHEFLFERYAARARVPDALSITPDAERALLAAAYHAERKGAKHQLTWIQQAYPPFHTAARWRVLAHLYDSALGNFTEHSVERAWLLHELALVRQAMGRNAEAETLYVQALEIKKTALGEAHPDYATTLHELARVRQAMGRNAEAETLYEQALEINKTALGETHPHYATTLHALASVRQAMGRNAEAEMLYEQVRSIEKTTLGKAHPSFATTLHQLALVRQAMGRNAEAETLYKQALEIYKTALGETHPHYAATLHELAHVRQAMGRNAEAETLYVQALEINKTALGEAHPNYATTLHELARVRQAMGRHAEAETLYLQALEIYKTALGEAHPHAILCLASLAGCKAALGNLDDARAMIEEAIGKAGALTEQSSLWSGRVHLKWALGLSEAGLTAEALKEARAAFALLSDMLGPEAAFSVEARTLVDRLESQP